MQIDDYTLMNDPETQRNGLLESTSAEHREAVDAAVQFAERIHAGQFRKSTEATGKIPYIVHPLRVARVIAEEWKAGSVSALQAALLHDVLEDCKPEEREQIEQEMRHAFGKSIVHAVRTLTKPVIGPAEVKAVRDARYFKELFAAPKWVRLIKCADRVDNLRDARAWGDPTFWDHYSSETIGWHLYLARATAPVAVVALFKALVEGERVVRGRVPVWADGHLVDPFAAALIPEHIARAHRVIGMAVQGETLIVGTQDPEDAGVLDAVGLCIRGASSTTVTRIHPIPLSAEAVSDALAACLYGSLDPA